MDWGCFPSSLFTTPPVGPSPESKRSNSRAVSTLVYFLYPYLDKSSFTSSAPQAKTIAPTFISTSWCFWLKSIASGLHASTHGGTSLSPHFF